jgi:uncharacterized protein with PIN domain
MGMKIILDKSMNDHRLVRLLRKMGHEITIAPQGHDSKIIELANSKCEPIVTKDVDFYKLKQHDRKKITNGVIYVKCDWASIKFKQFALQAASAIDHSIKCFDLTDQIIRVTCFTPEGSTIIQKQITIDQVEPLGWIWYVEQLVVTDSAQYTHEFKSVNQLEATSTWTFIQEKPE